MQNSTRLIVVVALALMALFGEASAARANTNYTIKVIDETSGNVVATTLYIQMYKSDQTSPITLTPTTGSPANILSTTSGTFTFSIDPSTLGTNKTVYIRITRGAVTLAIDSQSGNPPRNQSFTVAIGGP